MARRAGFHLRFGVFFGCPLALLDFLLAHLGFDQFWKRKDELLAALGEYQRGRGYLLSTLLITDVATQNSMLLAAGSETFLDRFDYPKLEPGIYELRGVVSRKKQLLPYLTHCLQRMRTEV